MFARDGGIHTYSIVAMPTPLLADCVGGNYLLPRGSCLAGRGLEYMVRMHVSPMRWIEVQWDEMQEVGESVQWDSHLRD